MGQRASIILGVCVFFMLGCLAGKPSAPAQPPAPAPAAIEKHFLEVGKTYVIDMFESKVLEEPRDGWVKVEWQVTAEKAPIIMWLNLRLVKMIMIKPIAK